MNKYNILIILVRLQAHRDAERHLSQQKKSGQRTRIENLRAGRKRRSGMEDACNHHEVGCWACDSGHAIPQPVDLGKFGDIICDYCDAWLLPDETSRHCCANGSVRVGDFNEDIPDLLMHFYSQYAKYAYAYNTLLAMASTTTQNEERPNYNICLMNGNISHRLSDLSVGLYLP